jgi:hypothetical protein
VIPHRSAMLVAFFNIRFHCLARTHLSPTRNVRAKTQRQGLRFMMRWAFVLLYFVGDDDHGEASTRIQRWRCGPHLLRCRSCRWYQGKLLPGPIMANTRKEYGSFGAGSSATNCRKLLTLSSSFTCLLGVEYHAYLSISFKLIV